MVLTDQQALLTCVVLLLTALFVLRRRTRLEDASHPPRRRPVTQDELGRVVFEVARSADLDAYRGLFLAGREVREALGKNADRYLDARTHLLLQESLVNIGARVADGSHYGACHVVGNEARIEVRLPGGDVRQVPIGTIMRIRGVWRLRDPVTE